MWPGINTPGKLTPQFSHRCAYVKRRNLSPKLLYKEILVLKTMIQIYSSNHRSKMVLSHYLWISFQNILSFNLQLSYYNHSLENAHIAICNVDNLKASYITIGNTRLEADIKQQFKSLKQIPLNIILKEDNKQNTDLGLVQALV